MTTDPEPQHDALDLDVVREIFDSSTDFTVGIEEEFAIVDHGRIVATGALDWLRGASRRRRIELRLDGAPAGGRPDVAGVELVESRNGELRLLVASDVDPAQVLAAAERAGRVVGFAYGPPSLAELFLELVSP